MASKLRIRDQPGVAIACIGISSANGAVAVALSPALPVIARELGQGQDGAFVAQMLQSLPALTIVLGAAIAGYLSEWLGRRLVLAIMVTLFTMAGLAGLVAPTIGTLAFTRAVHGFAAGVMVTGSYAAAGEYFDGPARNRMIGYCAGGGAFISIIALLAAGPMVDRFGWRSVFLLFLPTILLVPLVLRFMRKGRPSRAPGEALSWKPILAIWPLWFAQIVYTIGMFMSVIQVPFIASSKGIASGFTIGLLVATTSAVATLASLLHGTFRRYLSVQGMFVLMSLAFGTGLFLCAGAHRLPLFVVGAIALGLGAGSVEPTIMSRAINNTPERLHDRAAGAGIATLFAGQFLNPVAVYPLAKFGGVDFAANIFGILYIVAGLLFLTVPLIRRGRWSTA